MFNGSFQYMLHTAFLVDLYWAQNVRPNFIQYYGTVLQHSTVLQYYSRFLKIACTTVRRLLPLSVSYVHIVPYFATYGAVKNQYCSNRIIRRTTVSCTCNVFNNSCCKCRMHYMYHNKKPKTFSRREGAYLLSLFVQW